ncbi:hypothetical protein MKJ04_07690 [Pontibacter sp. E15-1]|uniref:hypothetical protein n=1 Tax=Pontibacter sp. E15-1 TaxID=2919918 RepID=UPI001F4F6072|nr:hypothetical protein [Pontibacter sp. E15-1]MCJ8164721.1 hypothetical protein [Pontibacter sp. E15-1]
MKTNLLYLLSFAAALTLTGCPDPVCFNPEPVYSFAVTAHFTPEQDSIQVGDTLYLISEFPSTMRPVGGQEAVVYTNSTGIGNTLGVLELTPNKSTLDAVYSFDYFNVDGMIYNSKKIPTPERAQQIRYKEEGEKYILKVGIIPKKRGTYSLIIGSGLSNGRRTGDECSKASFSTSLTNTDYHQYLYESWWGEPVSPEPDYRYLFKVY